MSSTLVALAVAVALTAAVVVIGLRRNLSETTREGLPRFEDDSEGEAPTLGLYEGEERPQAPLSPRQRWGLAGLYVVWGLMQAWSAVDSSDDRPIHAALAVGLVLGAVIIVLRKPRPPAEPAS